MQANQIIATLLEDKESVITLAARDVMEAAMAEQDITLPGGLEIRIREQTNFGEDIEDDPESVEFSFDAYFDGDCIASASDTVPYGEEAGIFTTIETLLEEAKTVLIGIISKGNATADYWLALQPLVHLYELRLLAGKVDPPPEITSILL